MIISPRWRKVINDLWENKARTALVVLAIAVGVFAFGGVFISRDIMIADMNAQWKATSPSSISLSMSNFDEDVVRAVTSMRNVEAAEGLAYAPLKLIGDKRDYNIDVYALNDYEDIKVNKLFPEEGEWPPVRRRIYLERQTADFIGADVGDTITVELPDGQQKDLVVGGTVHDYNAIPPTLFPWMTGYVTVETLEWLGLNADFTTLRIATDPSITDMEEIDQIATDLRTALQHDGYWVGFSETTDPTKHWGADTTNGITVVLAGIGFFTLILSGFLVVNTISAVLTQQKRQIGMMKAIGATGGQVSGVYFTMVAAFGILALFVALPVGIALGYWMTKIVADYLNFDIANNGIISWIVNVPRWVIIAQVIASLIAPLIAAIFPVLSGTRVTVREAVSDYGISDTGKKRGLLDRLITRVRGMSRPVLLSIRNTFRRKGRLLLTLTTLTMAGAIFISVINVRTSMLEEINLIVRLFQFDIQAALDDGYQERTVIREASQVEGITSLEAWTAADVAITREDGSEGSTFTLFGAPPDSPFIDAEVIDGRWLEPGDKNAVVLSDNILANDPGVGVGDEIIMEVNGVRRRWEIVGLLGSFGDAYFAYAPYEYLSQVQGIPGLAYVVFVGTEQHDGDFQSNVAFDLEEHLKDRGIGVSQLMTGDEMIKSSVGQIDFLVLFLLMLASLIAIVGGLGLAGTMSLNVLERTREIGVMRSIGAGNPSLRQIVVTEGILIGLISWALAIVVSIPLTAFSVHWIGIAVMERPAVFAYSPLGVIIWLIIVTIISTVASLMPARRAARTSVREALAYE
ncbi:MAG: FtsX-like permease family protein [Anaerolineae bacterium]|nr:FtsX-like permease family protein [Anaerolineae bacterium]